MPLFPQHSQRTSQQAPTPAAASTLLRRYRPLETRAAGGFGSVEICLDARLQRRVAIKRMPLMAESGMPATAVECALTEARTASMLQHPNIVSVIDFTYDSAYAYLVMEYVDGMSLAEFLERVDGNSLTFDEAAAIADALVQALQLAHENGVLHLDIKPANVLIDRAGHVKLTDFGMATLSAAAGFGGARGGTIGYMPPEQLDNQDVDQRTDLFALACVLYEALCGTSPFRATTPAGSLDRIIKGVTYPSELIPSIPELSEAALVAALSPMPQDRPLTADAFGDRFLAQLGNVRAGRKSLAHMIEELCAADEEPGEEPAGAAEPARIETDPAEGILGSRDGRAREYAVRAVAGISCTAVAWQMLTGMGISGGTGAAAASLAIGAAAAVAPQIGSALAAAGFLLLVCNATVAGSGMLAVLPVAVLVFALFAAWWLVWGRTSPAASATLTVSLALGYAPGSGLAVMLGGVAAAEWPVGAAVCLAAYLLTPSTAAVTCGFSLVLARLWSAAGTSQGVLTAYSAASALASTTFWLQVLLTAGAAAGLSLMLERAWEAFDQRGSTVFENGAIAIAGIAGFALAALARPMEIASLQPQSVAKAVGAGILSSIISGICLYCFGYRKEPSEGDRS